MTSTPMTTRITQLTDFHDVTLGKIVFSKHAVDEAPHEVLVAGPANHLPREWNDDEPLTTLLVREYPCSDGTLVARTGEHDLKGHELNSPPGYSISQGVNQLSGLCLFEANEDLQGLCVLRGVLGEFGDSIGAQSSGDGGRRLRELVSLTACVLFRTHRLTLAD